MDRVYPNTLVPGGSSATWGSLLTPSYDRNGSLMINRGANNVAINGLISDLFEPTVMPEPSTAFLLTTGIGRIRKRSHRK
jgi:hypothetical protein